MNKLKVRYYVPNKEMHLQAYTLRVEIVNAENMSDSIFVMQRGVDKQDMFNHIASPLDMQEFPENSPNLDDEMPWFRVNKLELQFRGYKELEDTKYHIGMDILGLVRALNLKGEIDDMEEVTYE